MKTEQQIREELRLAYIELEDAIKQPAGQCIWRIAKRYVEALQWVLDEE